MDWPVTVTLPLGALNLDNQLDTPGVMLPTPMAALPVPVSSMLPLLLVRSMLALALSEWLSRRVARRIAGR